MGSEQADSTRFPHVAMLASPGVGHLIPVIELAKLLHLRHGLTVTIITYSDLSSPSQKTLLSSLPPAISSLTLPAIPLGDLPADARVETRLFAIVSRSVPHVEHALQSLQSSTNLVAYVVDLFCGDTVPAAKHLGVPSYMLFTSNFFLLSLLLHLPTLHESTSCKFRDLPEPLRLPGCVPLRGEDILDTIQDRSDDAYRWVLHMVGGFTEVDGMLVNSFEALEPDATGILTAHHEKRALPLVYPVGPIRRSDGDSGSRECLEWLDRQPHGSVLFVSFGSGGTLSCEQVKELALGLEDSGQRFLWVVRTPGDSLSAAAFFGVADGSDPLSFLPEGFLSRTQDVGMVIPNWAPQIEVLGHAAVGGFMTHCGWNSTLESLMNGVPIITWPLYAEQRMNAEMLVEGVKVALRPRAKESGLVRREEICKVVNELMEGENGKAVRSKAAEIGEAGRKAMEPEGSSFKALAGVVGKWLEGK